mgnify:CR=1 FL=1
MTKYIFDDILFEDAKIGQAVTVDIGNGYELTYGQLEDIMVLQGDVISAGDIIGKVAAPTKYYSVEGSNLYFSMKRNGEFDKPIIIYKLITLLYSYIIPIIPDVLVFFRSILRMIYPYIIYLVLEYSYSKETKNDIVKKNYILTKDKLKVIQEFIAVSDRENHNLEKLKLMKNKEDALFEREFEKYAKEMPD